MNRQLLRPKNSHKNISFNGIRIRIRKAQMLFQTYKLDPRDAIHAACAIESGIKEIISNDADFDKIKEIKRIMPR